MFFYDFELFIEAIHDDNMQNEGEMLADYYKHGYENT